MGRRELVRAVAGLMAFSCFGAACASSAGPASPPQIVALGDSVPRGTNCDCTPYPPLTASGLGAGTGRTVTATNDAVAGFTSADVLHQVESDANVIDHLRTADVVEIEIGANDVAYTSACGTATACYATKLAPLEQNLGTIVRRVHDLTAGHPVLVVLLDYWSVWLGGQYAAARGDVYVAAAETMTDQVNAAIRTIAAATDSAYVDLRAAFKGPDYSYDETHYLSTDGDHPNADGHRQIADAALAVIEPALHP